MIKNRIFRRRALVVLTMGVIASGLFEVKEVEADSACSGRFTDNGDGTILDNDTKLVWQQDVAAGTYVLQGALTYCANLSLAGGGWRLPSIYELHTIVDRSRHNPAIDSEVFLNTPSQSFWSSSLFVNSGSSAFVVFFKSGRIQIDSSIAASKNHVRCLR